MVSYFILQEFCMMMIRRGVPFLLALFFLLSPFSVSAQEDGNDADEIPVESDWDAGPATLYSAGDKTFSISIGVLFPVLFLNEGGEPYARNYPPGNVHIGGTGSLSFNYFLSPHLFLGGELEGMFAGTLGGNMLSIVPMGIKVGYQFIAGSFEFPLSLMAGIAPQSYSNNIGYFGFFLKPQGAVFWRFNPEWSFGLNTGWWFVPQWPAAGPEHHRYGNFIELTFSARYHF
jgi:hypothetical protein